MVRTQLVLTAFNNAPILATVQERMRRATHVLERSSEVKPEIRNFKNETMSFIIIFSSSPGRII